MPMGDNCSIEKIESGIDATFVASKLVEVGYGQAVWTLLSVMEDLYLARRHQASSEEALRVFADLYINALTHPLRVCTQKGAINGQKVENRLINDHYQLAVDWLRAAKDYSQFCSLFPLWHRRKISIAVTDKRLVVEHRSLDHRYEAYNRLVRKEARDDPAVPAPHDRLSALLRAALSIDGDQFALNFNPRLASALIAWLTPALDRRHSLPDDWQFLGFSLQQYRKIIITVQSLLYGWHQVRGILANQGMPALGYRSAVWIVPKEELLARLTRYTEIGRYVVRTVLELITFGSSGIRNPDIATQPLIDLRDGTYGLSSFVWLNSDVERNLCALLNQIPEQKKLYAALTNEKEVATRGEIIAFLTSLGLEFKRGVVKGTDLDLAVVDRANKICLCLELKWFIEPAEIREIDERTKELAAGVEQAKIINALYRARDKSLVRDVLGIEPDFTFLSVVASQNWIGHDDVQCPEVPIIKVWHLLNRIKDSGSLAGIVGWLTKREYLPQEGAHYSVEPWEIACGEWRANWYGIKPLIGGTALAFREPHPAS